MKSLVGKLGVKQGSERLLAAIYFAFFNSGMAYILLGSILPRLREEHGLSYAQSGMIISAEQIGYICAVFLSGVLPFRIGSKRSTLLLGSGVIAGLLLVTLTGQPLLLLAAYILTGISRGTMSNVCNSAVSGAVGNRTAALNLLHACFAVGALSSPLLLLLAAGFGWRAAPYVLSALALSAFVQLARSDLPEAPAAKPAEGSLAFLGSWSFRINTAILFFYLCAEASIVGWFVLYFTDAGLLPKTLAGITPTLLWFMILIGRLICASLPEGIDKNKLSLTLGLSFAAFFGGLLLTSSPPAVIVCLLGIGVSMAGIYPTTFASIDNTSSAAVTGAVMSIATLGAVIMPGIVGALADAYGLGWGIAAVMGALAAMAGLMLIKIIVARKA